MGMWTTQAPGPSSLMKQFLGSIPIQNNVETGPGAENGAETRRRRTEPVSNPVGSGRRPRTRRAPSLPERSADGGGCICLGVPRPAPRMVGQLVVGPLFSAITSLFEGMEVGDHIGELSHGQGVQ